MCVFPYKIGNFCKIFFLLFPLGEKRENTLKTGPKGDGQQRVNINENKICFKWSVIKWETFIRKCFFF